MNEINARRARLQLGLVTVFERVYHLRGRLIEYQLRLG